MPNFVSTGLGPKYFCFLEIRLVVFANTFKDVY